MQAYGHGLRPPARVTDDDCHMLMHPVGFAEQHEAAVLGLGERNAGFADSGPQARPTSAQAQRLVGLYRQQLAAGQLVLDRTTRSLRHGKCQCGRDKLGTGKKTQCRKIGLVGVH